MAQVRDGTPFENPHALKGSLTRLKRLQRVVSRRQKGSANIRKDALHQATTFLATLAPARSAGETQSAIMLENLNVRGMLKNHHLAQAIADVGLYEFRRQLQSKGQRYGCEGKLADRFFPSTKRCCRCGKEKEVRLAERV